MTEISEAQGEFAKRQTEKVTDNSEWTPSKPDALPKTYTQTVHRRSFLDRLLGRNKKAPEPAIPEGTPPAMPAAVNTHGESIHGISDPNEVAKNQSEEEKLQSPGPANPEVEADPLAQKASSQFTEQTYKPDLPVDPAQPTVPGTRADYSGEWQPADTQTGKENS